MTQTTFEDNQNHQVAYRLNQIFLQSLIRDLRSSEMSKKNIGDRVNSDSLGFA